MHRSSTVALLALALALATATSTASAAGRTGCAIPRGAEVVQTAGTTAAYRFAGGPLLVCGSFPGPLNLGSEDVTGVDGRASSIAQGWLSEGCAFSTSTSYSYKYPSYQDLRIVHFGTRDRSSVTMPENVVLEVSAVQWGPGCSAAFTSDRSGPYPDHRAWRLDANGLVDRGSEATLDAVTAELSGPPRWVGRLDPALPSARATGPKLGVRPVLTLRPSKPRTGRVSLRFGGTYLTGLTVWLNGRRLPVQQETLNTGIPDPVDEAPRPIAPLRVEMPQTLAARLRAGTTYTVEIIACNGTCRHQK